DLLLGERLDRLRFGVVHGGAELIVRREKHDLALPTVRYDDVDLFIAVVVSGLTPPPVQPPVEAAPVDELELVLVERVDRRVVRWSTLTAPPYVLGDASLGRRTAAVDQEGFYRGEPLCPRPDEPDGPT